MDIDVAAGFAKRRIRLLARFGEFSSSRGVELGIQTDISILTGNDNTSTVFRADDGSIWTLVS